ncbi:hypothetical protein E2558_11350 [Staphylococcus pragensis]|uniref:GRAM domain-containing protein n=1 Tax=Staphylococcus pragensis TaxID=1611836 RepID=A0A4Z1AUU1_9STAP|nr:MULTISPECIES: GRAM domain-containing protein [Staphylococcus]RTX92118.1 hypothetical protein CD154_00475 [Staphylococcus carnosus]TGN23203.1 hypothetical protein E2558_11350 [Staphylococcus pragensis]GGG96703.1 hypothetical protein GCM10007342_20300 [Staphylococcus pragensis]
MEITTNCSLKTFIYRRVSVPGSLTLTNHHLTFASFSLTNSPLNIQIPLEDIKKVKLKKGIFIKSLGIFYNNDWYVFKYFQDDNYNKIYNHLNQKQK